MSSLSLVFIISSRCHWSGHHFVFSINSGYFVTVWNACNIHFLVFSSLRFFWLDIIFCYLLLLHHGGICRTYFLLFIVQNCYSVFQDNIIICYCSKHFFHCSGLCRTIFCYFIVLNCRSIIHVFAEHNFFSYLLFRTVTLSFISLQNIIFSYFVVQNCYSVIQVFTEHNFL